MPNTQPAQLPKGTTRYSLGEGYYLDVGSAICSDDFIPMDICILRGNGLGGERDGIGLHHMTASEAKAFSLAVAAHLAPAPTVPTSEPCDFAQAEAKRHFDALVLIATAPPSETREDLVKRAMNALNWTVYNPAHPIPQAAPTAEAVVMEIRADIKACACQLGDNMEAIIQRALSTEFALGQKAGMDKADKVFSEASAHLAAAPGVERREEDKYYLKSSINNEWLQVSKEEWIRAERAAGFRPKMASDNPRYMQVCATGGFSSSYGISGKVEYAKVIEYPRPVYVKKALKAVGAHSQDFNLLKQTLANYISTLEDALTAPAQPDTLIREAAIEECARLADELSERMKTKGGWGVMNIVEVLARDIRALAAAPGKREGVA